MTATRCRRFIVTHVIRRLIDQRWFNERWRTGIVVPNRTMRNFRVAGL